MRNLNQLPSIYGRYILLNKFAIGGMAEVFRAKSYGAEDFEKLIAIKRLYPHLSDDPSFVKMFINEAKLAATLNHVNIAPIYDFGCQQGFYYIAMEYVRGCDLADLISRCRHRQQQIPLGLAAWLLIEICNGLDYAHRKHDDLGRFLNLIHRDITPQNILISFEGEVKITDFGIAKVQMLERDETTGGLLKGKFSYMSPEQVRGDKMDHRSDIFSLGIVAWELLTNQKMFDGPNDYSILEKVREAMYIPASQINPHLPIDIEQILTKALTRHPAERYQSVGQMRLDLLRYLSNSGLFPSRAHLSAFVRKLFDDKLQREFKEIASETKVSRKIWNNFRDEIEAAALKRHPLTIPPEGLAQIVSQSDLPSARTGTPQGPPGWSAPVESYTPPGESIPQEFPTRSLSSVQNPIPSRRLQQTGGAYPQSEEFIPQQAHLQPSQASTHPERAPGSSQMPSPIHSFPPVSVHDTIGAHVPGGYGEEDDATLPDINNEPPTPRPGHPGSPAFYSPASPQRNHPVGDPLHSAPHSYSAQHKRNAMDPYDPDEELSIHRFGYNKNLSFVVGLSTFIFGVILVLLLAKWFFPDQTTRSVKPESSVQKLAPMTPGSQGK